MSTPIKMGQVIGPISPEDWITLRQLRSSMNWYKQERDNNKYGTAYAKEKGWFDAILKPYVAAA
jgi:hypothetical protein